MTNIVRSFGGKVSVVKTVSCTERVYSLNLCREPVSLLLMLLGVPISMSQSECLLSVPGAEEPLGIYTYFEF